MEDKASTTASKIPTKRQDPEEEFLNDLFGAKLKACHTTAVR